MDLGRDIEALSANFSDLVGQHLKIARLELIEDLKRVGRRAVFVAAMVPFGIAAFVLLTQAAVALLSRWWPEEAALAAVGVVYGLITAGAAYLATRPKNEPALLSESRREFAGTVKVLANAAKGAR